MDSSEKSGSDGCTVNQGGSLILRITLKISIVVLLYAWNMCMCMYVMNECNM
jgi:hypothetical protein